MAELSTERSVTFDPRKPSLDDEFSNLSQELRSKLQRPQTDSPTPLQRFNSLGSEKSTRISYTDSSADAYNQ